MKSDGRWRFKVLIRNKKFEELITKKEKDVLSKRKRERRWLYTIRIMASLKLKEAFVKL